MQKSALRWGPLAALVYLLGCGGPAKPEAAPDGAAAEAPQPVVVGAEDIFTAATSTVADGPRIAGTLQAAKQAIIRAEAGGSVLAVGVELGDKVEPGQLLARIEANAASKAYSSAKSGTVAAQQEVDLAQKDLDRTRALVEGGALSPQQLERAEAALIGAQARLEGARAQQTSAGEQLGSATVKAPFAGLVAQRGVNVGDIVAPGAQLFTVLDPSSLRLEGSVPAAALGSLTVGTTVRFTVQGYEGRSFEGTVDRVAPAVDPATRQIPILVSIPNQDGTLLAGLFAEGRVSAQARQGVVVPADAIDLTGTAPAVARVQGGKVERVAVQLGIRDENTEQVEIVSGINAGDQVLVGAARTLADGTPLDIRQGDAVTERTER